MSVACCASRVTFENDSQLYALGTTAGSICIHHRRDKMLEGGGGVAATAGVNG